MTTITLHTKNPLDIPPQELDDLAGAIRTLDPVYAVEITSGDQRGVAVTWWEVIECYVPWDDLKGPAAGALVTQLVTFLRNRFMKEPKRPKVVTIFGPREEVLKRVAIENPDDRLEDEM